MASGAAFARFLQADCLQLTHERLLPLMELKIHLLIEQAYYIRTGVVCQPFSLILALFMTDLWCRRWDSNPHVLRHTYLKRARIPVPPRRLKVP